MNCKVVIYGATGGIGSAVARALHSAGRSLHLVGRDESKTKAVAGEMTATWTCGDVTDENLFGKVADDAGSPVAGLVYAVGTLNLNKFECLTQDDYLRDLKINAISAALAVQALVPALKAYEGGSASVVLYSSVAARQGFSYHASMGMAKAAVSGLTLSLAAELAPHIRVNAIAPSLTQTPLAKGILTSEQMKKGIARMHALQRLGSADEMAALSAFLLSPDAGWITGQIIGVDGGRSTVRSKS